VHHGDLFHSDRLLDEIVQPPSAVFAGSGGGAVDDFAHGADNGDLIARG